MTPRSVVVSVVVVVVISVLDFVFYIFIACFWALCMCPLCCLITLTAITHNYALSLAHYRALYLALSFPLGCN